MKSLFKIFNHQAGHSALLKGALKAITVEEADNVLKELFGEQVDKFAQARYIKDKVLAISCQGSIVTQEIKLNQDKIIEKINESAGEDVVERIKIILSS
jgi:hypothetical protein